MEHGLRFIKFDGYLVWRAPDNNVPIAISMPRHSASTPLYEMTFGLT